MCPRLALNSKSFRPSFLSAGITGAFLFLVNQPCVFGGALSKYIDFFLQEGKEFAESKSLMFMETSAKLNYQVSEIFNTVGE